MRQQIFQTTAEAILYQLPGDLHRRMKRTIWHLLSSSKSVVSVSMVGAESLKIRTAPLDTRSRSDLWGKMKDIISSTIRNGLSYPCLSTMSEEGIDEDPKRNVLYNEGDKDTDEITQYLT